MAMICRLLEFFSFALFITSIFASTSPSPVSDWETVAATLRGTLDVLQLSHEQYLAESSTRHARRGSTFRTGPAGYWHPMNAARRPAPSDENFSEQLNDLIIEIASAVEQLIELLASQFNIQGLLSSTIAPTLPTPTPTTPIEASILPITNLHTTPTISFTIPANPETPIPFTSQSLVPDRPFTGSLSASPPSATHTFNPIATDLNVVYYSQTDLTPVISLTQVCNDPDIDMVIIAFITSLVSAGGYPSMNMASNCWAPNTAQQVAGATGLLDCVSDGFAAKIRQCQRQGKKVLLSLGGSVGNLALSSSAQAEQVANTLWNLFLGGTDPTITPLRPYGNVTFDGIDIDNESPSAAIYLPTLASTLRQLMSNAPSSTPGGSSNNKAYYLSAAPQCPRPDLSVPIPSLLPYLDFISVQFYNNPSCQLGTSSGAINPGFIPSLQAWSNDLLAATASSSPPSSARIKKPRSSSSSPPFQAMNNGIPSPRLLIGTPAFAGAGSGFVVPQTYKSLLEQVKALDLPNLAGAMYWDGAYQEVSGAVVDGVANTTFARVVKEVLG